MRFQQGFFSVSRTCQNCRGSGSIVKDPCNGCRGSGKTKKDVELEINIPAGVDTGHRLKLVGRGGPGLKGGPGGDLYVVIQIDEHQFFERDGEIFWRRPGKTEGISATTGYAGTGYLYVFSTSTLFDAERGYSKFSAFALLNYDGDHSAAAMTLASLGYGNKPEPSHNPKSQHRKL